MWAQVVHVVIDGVDSWRRSIIRTSVRFVEALTVSSDVSSSFMRGSCSSGGLLWRWRGE